MGLSEQTEIIRTIVGNININDILFGEPLLTLDFRVYGGLVRVGSQTIILEAACRTAELMRFSENSVFPLVPFQSFTNLTQFQLGEGGGEKTIYAQFRSVSGITDQPISITITYVKEGPVITSFSLNEGMILRRPLIITGSAYATLGMSNIEFYIDNTLISRVSGGNYSERLDVRNVANGVRRAKLLARDSFNNISILERNVIINVEPPSAPAITQPQSGILITSNIITFTSSSEPYIGISLKRGGTTLGLTQTDANGIFVFTNVTLIEGRNEIIASAFDEIRSASGPACVIVVDSGPLMPVIMNEPFYNQRDGLYLSWRYQPADERATKFRVLWNTNLFTNPTEAIGQSPVITGMEYIIKGIPDGNYCFGVIGYDEAGNVSALSQLINFTYDETPPRFAIFYDKTSPLSASKVRITLTSSEALRCLPGLTVKFANSQPVALPLSTGTGANAYSAELSITPITKSGPVEFRISGMDIVGNVFEGIPQGETLVVDVNPPVGRIICSPQSSAQITNPVDVSISLLLSEPQKAGNPPVLSFKPPAGSNVFISLTGSGTNWSGLLRLEPSMGSGLGSFAMHAIDALDNVRQYIESGAFLEVYNTALPSPQAPPAGLITVSRPGGYIELRWNNVSDAESYRVYSEAGSNTVTPSIVVADAILTNYYIDLPPADGPYRYVVTASRRGAESVGSIIKVAISDRTPPPPPPNVNVPPGFESTIIAVVKNEGLLQINYIVIEGTELPDLLIAQQEGLPDWDNSLLILQQSLQDSMATDSARICAVR